MESLRTNYPAPRRVATAPIPTPAPAPRSTSAGGLVETLYNHPNVKIVAFSAASRGRARSPGRGPADEPGTLSAYSQLERTIAVGPFRIYRTGSVAFLNCGSALQPMLPKSQCWALEEDSSKFVLQIRRPNYWRIEIPVTNPTEQELAAAFKVVLDQILQFEKTECPFRRSFTILLPEKPNTPVKKRPWTPPVKRALPVLSTPTHEISPTQPRALTPKTPKRRASTSLSLRGRAEQRRFSVIGTEFQSSSESRDTSIDTSPSFDPPREQRPINDLAIAEEKTETEGPTSESAVNAQPLLDSPQVPFDEGEAGDAGSFEAAASVDEVDEPCHVDVALPKRAEPKNVELAAVVEKRFDEPVQSTGEQLDRIPDTKGVFPNGKEQESEEQGETSRPTTAIAVASAKPLLSKENMTIAQPPSKSKRSYAQLGDKKPSACLGNMEPEKRSSKLMIPGRSRALSSPTAQPQIKEQLITVEMTPRTVSALEVGTPTPTNIYDVIRNYEQKLAATTSTLATAEETKLVGDEPNVAFDSTGDTGPGLESTSGTDGEVLEGSGVGGGKRKKLRSFRKGRALVPPQLTLVTSPPSKSAARKTPILEADDAEEPLSPTGSADSFHSVKSRHSPVTPVPRSPASDVSPTRFPYPHDNILIPKKPWHYRDVSDLTVTPETRRTWDAISSITDDSSLESAATAPDMPSEAVEQPGKTALSEDEAATTAAPRRPYIRHRATPSSISVGRNGLSPLPPPANLFAPTTTATRRQPFLRSQLEIVRRIPMAIVSKTCEMLLGPPSHLIALMLQVAAKIAAGQWRGMMFGYGEGGETIPVQWDYSDDEYSSWGEDDDYYLSQVESSCANSVIGSDDRDDEAADDAADGNGRGWEVD
ncbi:hypothetical protein CkaCkLH20_12087 [Colletotrichum karsti]|uniref:Inheritance of peroxisomes protein 1 n=1 Tax=Colletotrichum karsti TaxID=1095194 RepID=A0A9P6LFC4_9PEZI|nr:uncharacterized protein CkaCkLH20_12087 [Colletotrichum karsti]KAF9870420.1 hypothetical protein CkaCkLH20_12087 [Colletotrichum karsti]